MMLLLLPTYASTVNLSGTRPGPTTAWAVPLPALEPAGQALLPRLLSVAAVQYLKPLPLSLTFLATNTVMDETVASVRLFFTNSFRVEFFGLVFLPALAGETVALTSGALGSVFWAMATDVTARDNTAASAAIRYLRKEAPQEFVYAREGGQPRDRPS